MGVDGNATKSDTGKIRMDLIPAGPLMELARVYTIGSAKYGDYNWMKGMKFGRVFAAMMRHAWKWWRGEEFDPDGQHHLDSVAWCAFTLRYFRLYEKKYQEFDDRQKEVEDAIHQQEKT
jgi:hypothetical protein